MTICQMPSQVKANGDEQLARLDLIVGGGWRFRVSRPLFLLLPELWQVEQPVGRSAIRRNDRFVRQRERSTYIYFRKFSPFLQMKFSPPTLNCY